MEYSPHYHPILLQPSLDSSVQSREKTSPFPPFVRQSILYPLWKRPNPSSRPHPPPMSPSSGHLGDHQPRASVNLDRRARHHWVPSSQHPFSAVQELPFILSTIFRGMAPQWRKSLCAQSPVGSPRTTNSTAGVSRTLIPDDPGD